jgi:hypothetical protein
MIPLGMEVTLGGARAKVKAAAVIPDTFIQVYLERRVKVEPAPRDGAEVKEKINLREVSTVLRAVDPSKAAIETNGVHALQVVGILDPSSAFLVDSAPYRKAEVQGVFLQQQQHRRHLSGRLVLILTVLTLYLILAPRCSMKREATSFTIQRASYIMVIKN